VPYFGLRAPRVPSGPLLQLLCDVILEVPHDELRHMLSFLDDDIMISVERVA
jgi:hypothetical protein